MCGRAGRGVSPSLILALQSCKAPRGVYPDFTSCEIWDTSRYGEPPRPALGNFGNYRGCKGGEITEYYGYAQDDLKHYTCYRRNPAPSTGRPANAPAAPCRDGAPADRVKTGSKSTVGDPGSVGGSMPQPASSVRKRTVLPGSMVKTGGKSGEKCPCNVRRSGSRVWMVMAIPSIGVSSNPTLKSS